MERRLSREARRQRRTRSEMARAILEAALSGQPLPDPHEEARRQSVLASASAATDTAHQFIADAADLRGWK
jgi:hypothetical protein